MTDPTSSPPSPPSEMERRFYYAGLPSAPLLVARSGTTPWEAPTGPEVYTRRKQLWPVGNHAIADVWEDELALKVHTLLKTMKVEWTSIDILRIGYDHEEYPNYPVVVWIGVVPASLSGADGVVVAHMCRQILEEHHITDVDVEIRESVVVNLVETRDH